MINLIGFNLIGGPILFFFGGAVAHQLNFPIGLIVTLFFISYGSYTARKYFSLSQGSVNKLIALVVNAIALFMAGASLYGNYLRIDHFGENSRAFVSFVGVWLLIIPIIVMCGTLYVLVTHKKTDNEINESEGDDRITE